ncbi:UNVERIFIED_ORG: hypothetical protein GGI63_004640 [Rhizobium esperanzae]
MILATVFAISTTRTTFAAAVDPRINVTSDPKTVCEPRGYCPWPSVPGLIFTYDQVIDGDVVVWRYVGFKGAVPVGLVGLPPMAS